MAAPSALQRAAFSPRFFLGSGVSFALWRAATAELQTSVRSQVRPRRTEKRLCRRLSLAPLGPAVEERDGESRSDSSDPGLQAGSGLQSELQRSLPASTAGLVVHC